MSNPQDRGEGGPQKTTRREFLRQAAGLGAAAAVGAHVPLFSRYALAAPGPRTDLVVGLFGEPPQFNPFFRKDVIGDIVASNIYLRLTRVDPARREIVPELAERWEAVNPLTWRIKLREGVQWHKGYGEVTAEDLAYTWTYVLEKRTFQLGNTLFPVQSVRPLDRYTVEVKLRTPFGAFPAVTMDFGGEVVSKRAHEELGPERYGREPVGNGPFELEQWSRGSQIVLRRNPRFYQRGRPFLERIVYRFIPDATVRLQALLRGEIDFMTNPDPKDIPDLRAGRNPNIVYTSVPGWNWDYMMFTFPPHIREDFPTARSREVRQAISYAIDRQTIVREIYMDEATVTDNPIPPGFLAYRPGPLRYPARRDLSRARSLMQASGAGRFDLEVITSDKPWLRQETELVASMLDDVGIRVRIVGLDIGTFNNRWLVRKDFQALLEDIVIVSPDTDSTLYWFHRPGNAQHAGWDRSDVTRWLDEARFMTRPEERVARYQRVVDAVLEDCPYIYHCHVNYVRLHRRGLTGYTPAPQEAQILFRDARWS